MTPDFSYTKHGSVWTIVAESVDAIKFASRHFAPGGWQGTPTHFTTDWRAARDLIERLKLEQGFLVEDNGD